MHHARGGFGLAEEPLAAIGARHVIATEHLDRDPAVELFVASLVDDAHSAAAEHRLYDITVHTIARRQIGGRGDRARVGELAEERVAFVG